MDAKPQKHEKVVRIGKIHETAIIHSGAVIGKNVEIGPYSIIGQNVEIGDGTVIGPHVIVDGYTKVGNHNEIYHGTSIGEPLRFNQNGSIVIGDNNIIRENVTIHPGEKGETTVGNNNFIMAYCNIAHDCQVGNNIIMTNAVNLGDHVVIEDKAVIAGLASIHKNVRVGTIAMVGAHSKVIKDVPPFILVDGRPAQVNGINVIGLRRNGFKPELRREIKRIYKILYRSDLNIKDAIREMNKREISCHEIDHFLEFLENAKAGICR